MVEERFECLYLAGCHKGLVALYVDDDIGIGAYLFTGFLNAVGPTFMVGACHNRLTAKRLDGIKDALVIGSDISLTQCFDSFFVNVLYDRSVA